MQNNLNSIAFGQGPATCESNNLPVPRASTNSVLGKTKGPLGSEDYQPAGETSTVKNDSGRTVPKTKSDMDLLAQNRGNAMLRYKEKRKTRRYGILNDLSLLCSRRGVFYIYRMRC